MKFRDRILQDRAGQDSIYESANDNQANQLYQNDNFRAENIRNKPACLSCRLHDDTINSIPYSLIQKMLFDPSGRIIISTTDTKVIIKGRQLRRLYDYLSAYRVSFLNVSLGIDSEESGLFIEDIFIENI